MDYQIIATAPGVEISEVVCFRVKPKGEDGERQCNTNEIGEQTPFSVAENKSNAVKPILG